MALSDFLKSLFGGKSTSSAPAEICDDPIEYKGFTIEAAPVLENGTYRTAGYISGELNGETRRVRFIRADQISDRQIAIDHCTSKARQIIDEQGAQLLNKLQL